MAIGVAIGVAIAWRWRDFLCSSTLLKGSTLTLFGVYAHVIIDVAVIVIAILIVIYYRSDVSIRPIQRSGRAAAPLTTWIGAVFHF